MHFHHFLPRIHWRSGIFRFISGVLGLWESLIRYCSSCHRWKFVSIGVEVSYVHAWLIDWSHRRLKRLCLNIYMLLFSQSTLICAQYCTYSRFEICDFASVCFLRMAPVYDSLMQYNACFWRCLTWGLAARFWLLLSRNCKKSTAFTCACDAQCSISAVCCLTGNQSISYTWSFQYLEDSSLCSGIFVIDFVCWVVCSINTSSVPYMKRLSCSARALSGCTP